MQPSHSKRVERPLEGPVELPQRVLVAARDRLEELALLMTLRSGCLPCAVHYPPVRLIGCPLSVAESAGDTLSPMPNEVTSAALRRLLDLQSEDTAIKQLETRRASLPEAQRLDELNDALAELEADLAIATKQSGEIAREQSRLEGEIQLLDGKIAREEERMFSGSVANPKELSALQSEVESRKRRRSQHEDALLDVMVQGEAATEMAERLGAERDESSARAIELGATVGALNDDIDAELSRHRAERESVLPDVPASVLQIYDRLREQKGGIGAAALVGGTCEGCHTKISNVEVERLRAATGLQRCENCRRILVVT